MIRRLHTLLAVLVLTAPFAAPAHAQVPKPGKEHVDSVDLGYKIKMPEGWDFVPPQPNEQNHIGKYTQGSNGLLRNPKNGQPLLEMDVELLKFDRRAKSAPKSIEGEGGEKITFVGAESFLKWVGSLRGNWKKLDTKQLTIGKTNAVRHLYTIELDSQEKISGMMLAYEYKLAPDLDIVMLGFGPAEPKKWDKFENAYDAMGKSFKPVEVTNAVGNPTGTSPRDFRRAELQKKVAANPGWSLYETPNYFVISSKDDKQFIQELLERLEAIHEVYVELYKPETLKALRAAAEARRAAEAAKKAAEKKAEDGKKEGEGAQDKPAEKPKDASDPEWQTVAAKADPAELAKCSVVRVCKDQQEYMAYGAPGGSAGYWSWMDQELVIFDDQASGGRRDTWATLNHEAFHQYIFYQLGQLSPHSWYNEGNGDYFSGYQLEHQKFKLKPFDWREGLVQENMKSDTIVPLKEFIYFEQPAYYSSNQKYGTDIGDHYAQGWSFIYFLRTGKKNAKGWNPAWDSILDVYLKTLVETDDLKGASDKAFAGIDFDELDSCWKKYILSI